MNRLLARFLLPAMAATSLLLPAAAGATVNTANGNWTIVYGDIEMGKAGGRLDLTRVYNNRDGRDGWFGVGWGTSFEHSLLAMADGSVVIQAFGGGALLQFGLPTQEAMEQGVDTLLGEMKKAGQVKDEDLPATRTRLLSSLEQRVNATRRLPMRFSIPVGKELPSGVRDSRLEDKLETLLSIPSFLLPLFPEIAEVLGEMRGRLASCGRVKRTETGFERIYCDSQLEIRHFEFDLQGRLQRVVWPDGYVISFQNGGPGDRPSRIIDSNQRTLDFKWDEKGHATEVSWIGNKGTLETNRYQYNEAGDLVFEQASNPGDRYIRTYDGRHNMTSITYIDDSKVSMSYDAKDRITEFVARSGKKQRFAYEKDGRGYQTTRMWVTGQTEPDLFVYSPENDIIKEVRNGVVKQEKKFNAKDQLVSVMVGGDTATATYDERGRRTSVSADGTTYTRSFDANDLPVRLGMEGDARAFGDFTFLLSYDRHKAITSVRIESDNPALAGTVRLIYDSTGAVSSIEDAAGGNEAKARLRLKVFDGYLNDAMSYESLFALGGFVKVEAPR